MQESELQHLYIYSCTCNTVEISYKQQCSVATYNANFVFLTWINIDTSVHLKLRISLEYPLGIIRANLSKMHLVSFNSYINFKAFWKSKEQEAHPKHLFYAVTEIK